MSLLYVSKNTGSAYGTFAHSKLVDFQWIAGESAVTRYESSPENLRAFCSTCGSAVPTCNAEYGSVCIPAGLFEDDPEIKPTLQIFTGSKVPWHHLGAELTSYEEFDPD